jgi:hypothetical protein
MRALIGRPEQTAIECPTLLLGKAAYRTLSICARSARNERAEQEAANSGIFLCKELDKYFVKERTHRLPTDHDLFQEK